MLLLLHSAAAAAAAVLLLLPLPLRTLILLRVTSGSRALKVFQSPQNTSGGLKKYTAGRPQAARGGGARAREHAGPRNRAGTRAELASHVQCGLRVCVVRRSLASSRST